LIALLAGGANPIVWNSAAIGLRDLGDARAVPALLSKLAARTTEGARGTLIYALQAFDCAPFVETLLDRAITRNYEVTREAASAISASIWSGPEASRRAGPLETYRPSDAPANAAGRARSRLGASRSSTGTIAFFGTTSARNDA